MKIVINRAALSESLAQASSMVIKKEGAELGRIRLEATGNVLRISATNQAQAVRVECTQVEVQGEGVATVSPEKFGQVVALETSDTLAVELTGGNLSIRSDSAAYKLAIGEASKFPPVLPPLSSDPDFTVAAGELLYAMTAVLGASGVEHVEPTRYALNGLSFKSPASGKLEIAGTDGRRLAVVRVDITGKSQHATTIPVVAVRFLQRLCKSLDKEDLLRMHTSESAFRVVANGVDFGTVLVEGQFPPYEDIIPADERVRLTACRTELLAALRRASIATSDESKGVRMTMNKTGLVISSRSYGEDASVKLPCQVTGGELEIGFNPVFFIKALGANEADDAVVSFTDANRPALVDRGLSARVVLMPVALA